MKLQSAAGHPSRQSVSRFIRAALGGCMTLLPIGVIVVAVAGMEPAPLAALTGGMACTAGVLVVAFQGVGRWARDPQYSLPGKRLALLFALCVAAIALLFGSNSL